jgi:hypothetical protein
MPIIELDDLELVEAALGQGCLAQLAQADADRQGQSSARGTIERSVRYHETLAAKFERARESGRTQQISEERRRPTGRKLGE